MIYVDTPDDGAAAHRTLAELFTAHSVELTGFAVRRVGASAAGDVVSETFLIAWQRLASVAPDHPREWLYAVASNVIRHHFRTAYRHDKLVDRMSQDLQVASAEVSQAARVETQLLIGTALSKLSARDQEVLLLAQWDQLSQVEIARVLGCTVAAVKVRLHRARRRFADGLDAEQRPAHPTACDTTAAHSDRGKDKAMTDRINAAMTVLAAADPSRTVDLVALCPPLDSIDLTLDNSRAPQAPSPGATAQSVPPATTSPVGYRGRRLRRRHRRRGGLAVGEPVRRTGGVRRHQKR